MSTPDEWRQEGWEEAIVEERDELLTQRQELLDALFSDYDTRQHLSAILLGATTKHEQVSSDSVVPSDLNDSLDPNNGSDLPPRDPE
jgi:hypothetical protein